MLAGFLCVGLVASRSAFAYNSNAHKEITREAVTGSLARPREAVGCPAGTDLSGFVRYLYREVASVGTEDARAFLARWPTEDDFGVREAKGFLDLTRTTNVWVAGLDFLPCEDDGTVLGLLVTESIRPDTDGRNLSRKEVFSGAIAHVGPEDPIILDLGGLDGLASQAHAHYLLAEDPGGWLSRGERAWRLKSAPLDLLRDPAHFAVATAVPGGPFTLGADMAMEHFLLALLASSWPDPASRRLSLSFLGHALHYVQDASNPLHTVQVGHACVVLHAFKAFLGRAVTTAGGYVGSLQGPTTVVADLVSNLHLWTEAFWDERGLRARGGPWTVAWGEITRAFLGDLLGGLLAAWRGAEAARSRGPDLFGAACRAVRPSVLRYGGVLKDGAFDATSLLEDEEAGRLVMWIGQEAASVALAESVAMLRAYEAVSPRMDCPHTRRVVAGLLASRMRAVEAREARLAAWKKAHPEGILPQNEPVRFPIILALEVAVILGLVAILIHRVRRVRA